MVITLVSFSGQRRAAESAQQWIRFRKHYRRCTVKAVKPHDDDVNDIVVQIKCILSIKMFQRKDTAHGERTPYTPAEYRKRASAHHCDSLYLFISSIHSFVSLISLDFNLIFALMVTCSSVNAQRMDLFAAKIRFTSFHTVKVFSDVTNNIIS